MGTVARADIIAPPKERKVAPAERTTKTSLQPQTLTGTLAWKTLRRGDGTEQRTMLQLTTPGKTVVDLLPAESVKNPSQYDAFVGKTVEVKVLTQPGPGTTGQPQTVIKRITAIREAPSPRS